MKKICLLLAAMAFGVIGVGQDISLTFSCTGESTRIDSIRATNLTTGNSITFPGNATLILTSGSGIQDDGGINTGGLIYPNPFYTGTTLAIRSAGIQQICITVSDLSGRLLVKCDRALQAGEEHFDIRTGRPGIFLVGVHGEGVSFTKKIVCLSGSSLKPEIDALGSFPSEPGDSGSWKVGLLVPMYQLSYSSGDVISFMVMAGENVTVFTESPTGSEHYDVEMITCSDAAGNRYPVVTIGDQTWMGRNLSYLPAVSPSSAGSSNDPCYYVYGYQGSGVTAARATQNFPVYGVLYNWAAAQSACPEGWHLPNDAEWKTLEEHIGMSGAEISGFGWRNSGMAGGQLKESGLLHWNEPNTAAANGYGFFALPAGYRGKDDGFYSLGFRAYFWTSTQGDQLTGMYRGLYYELGGIDRNNDYRSMGFSVRCIRNDPFYVQLPEVTTTDPSDVDQTTATTGGDVISDGGGPVTGRGVCWNTTGLPTFDDFYTVDGSGTGIFTSSLSGLTPGTPYFVRAWATNSAGTAFGEEKQFTTTEAATLPAVHTFDISDIGQTTATGGGNVSDDGGAEVTARGVCWNTTGNPTLAGDKTLDGSGTGAFISELSGLTSETPYFVRAYATNSKGTAYGDEKSFTTTGGDTEGTFEYAGKEYRYKTFGNQAWMMENLAYLPSVSPSGNGSETAPYYYVYDYQGDNVGEAQATANYSDFGVLYNYEAAKIACPPGWHLPSYGEWFVLVNYLTANGYGYGGSGSDIAKSLASTWGWRESVGDANPGCNQETNNSSGLSIPPGGSRGISGEFSGYIYTTPPECEKAVLWTASADPNLTYLAWYFSIEYMYPGVSSYPCSKGFGFSVRCVRD
jgi:uncharacterized protein (TIGR02145 family)